MLWVSHCDPWGHGRPGLSPAQTLLEQRVSNNPAPWGLWGSIQKSRGGGGRRERGGGGAGIKNSDLRVTDQDRRALAKPFRWLSSLPSPAHAPSTEPAVRSRLSQKQVLHNKLRSPEIHN